MTKEEYSRQFDSDEIKEMSRRRLSMLDAQEAVAKAQRRLIEEYFGK